MMSPQIDPNGSRAASGSPDWESSLRSEAETLSHDRVGQRGQGVAGTGVAPRERILQAFAERVRTGGIRSVVMGDLARELGMSKKTLYQHFESKDALVRATVERWLERLHVRAATPEAPLDDVVGLVRWGTDMWVRQQTDFSIEFWRDVRVDHPQTWQILQAGRSAGPSMHEAVGKRMRSDIPVPVIVELYFAAIRHFNDPAVCERIGVDRHEAVLAAVDVWTRGALRPTADDERQDH